MRQVEIIYSSKNRNRINEPLVVSHGVVWSAFDWLLAASVPVRTPSSQLGHATDSCLCVLPLCACRIKFLVGGGGGV